MSGRTGGLSRRWSWGLSALTVGFLSLAAGRTTAQVPPPSQPADYASVVDGRESDPGGGPAPVAPRASTGLFGTIAESFFGDVNAEGRWSPLGLRSFFSEGWHESWVAAPAGGEGLTPRQGWLNAFDGTFYPLSFFRHPE